MNDCVDGSQAMCRPEASRLSRATGTSAPYGTETGANFGDGEGDTPISSRA